MKEGLFMASQTPTFKTMAVPEEPEPRKTTAEPEEPEVFKTMAVPEEPPVAEKAKKSPFGGR